MSRENYFTFLTTLLLVFVIIELHTMKTIKFKYINFQETIKTPVLQQIP